ncbi:DNA-binding domain-containing protein [Actibacterium sp. MT2.3-13A]|uniref:HvfC/BufC N-terminal domain-containing protein n=1 Tax=Actibacterium sp. MT2.3-13A TaxID=2828332 RepID=UPI001BA5A694|nr:DNA-binding domain-containing protein [Actibacterium sp. MT2.3-13A]
MRQPGFTEALLDPARAVPAGLTDPQGRPAGKRFDVYRNNVAASLTAALETAFPVLRALLGAEFFRRMAGIYLRQHPPTLPLLMFYGAEMPAFLAHFPPVQDLGYLPDVARLELALRHSYHAADAAPVDPAALEAIAPERLMRARLRLAPALRLVRSDWPVVTLWQMHQPGGGAPPEMRAEDALLTRPGFDPAISPLPPGGAAFLLALQRGETFGAALGHAEAESHNFDLGAVLGLLLKGEAIIAIDHEDNR